MKKYKATLLSKEDLKKVVIRLSHEIIEKNSTLNDLAVIGIRTRGDVIAKRIVDNIKSINNTILEHGTLDVTFYRDDFSSNLGSPKVGPSDLNFDVNNKNIVLVDDVLYTGRTIKAAIEEIFSFGRPASIKLCVLVDRGHRELPIKADFVGKNYPTSINEHIHVYIKEIDNDEKVDLLTY
tara:strand:+ start:100 stop:639 length:540 start_codon:yes stop_codon:yes gene_type:complete